MDSRKIEPFSVFVENLVSIQRFNLVANETNLGFWFDCQIVISWRVSTVARYWALPTISEVPSPTIYLDDSESQIYPLIPSMLTRITRRIPIWSQWEWILFGWIEQGVGLHAGGGKKPLLSTGEDGSPVLGYFHPAPKSLCPGPQDVLRKAPYPIIFLLDIQLLFLYSPFFQSEFLSKSKMYLENIFKEEKRNEQKC